MCICNTHPNLVQFLSNTENSEIVLILNKLKSEGSNQIFVLDSWVSIISFTGYSFWDWLRNFLHKFTCIVLSVEQTG